MTNVRLEERTVAAYLGLALGDALGATVEFMTPREITSRFGLHREIVGGGWLNLKAGEVTDDTTMALALGEALLAGNGRADAGAIARAFDGWMRSKPVDIGNTVRRGIVHFRNTGEPGVPFDENGAGNGACMRVLPVAIATLGSPPEAVAEAVITQSRVTHHHPLSDAGSIAAARMVQGALQGLSLVELLRGPVASLITEHPEFAFRRRRAENPSGFIVHTLHVVLQALFDTDCFEACLVEAVNRGGDADTTGAIAGMIAGAVYGFDAIPRRWLRALNKEVRRRCEEQAARLLAIAPLCR